MNVDTQKPEAEKVDAEANQLPHLSISAHVVVQLGEELVTDVEQALLELAKNAYDADSKTCEIKVEPNWALNDTDPAYGLLFGKNSGQPQDVGRVRIRDHGTGLSEDAVKQGWLRISASLKRVEGNKSKNKTDMGRTPVGDKGLGRLATMKLGQILRMKTAVKDETSWRTVMFSWSDFTQDRTLDQVRVLVGVDTEEDVDGNGTIIEIMGLHEQERWADSSYVEKHLIPHLSSLINPFKAFDNFEISLNTGRHAYELHSLDDGVLNLSSAKFVFSWDGEKMVQETWIAPSLLRGARGEENAKRFKELFSDKEKPALIAWLQNDKKLKEKGISFNVDQPWFCKFSDELIGRPFPTDRKFPGGINPGSFHSTLYYFMFHESVKEKLVAAQVSSETLQAMSQVAIYRDGFRVRAHQDWLRLAEGTTSGSSYYGLRPANVLGYFSISNERNPGLVEKSDREGFVENPEFRGFMILGLRARDYANNVLEAIRKSAREYDKSRGDGTPPVGRKQLVESLSSSTEKTERGFVQLQNELVQTRNALAVSRKAAEQAGAAHGADSDHAFGRSVEVVDVHIANLNKAIDEMGLTVKRQTHASLQLAELSEDDEDYASRLLDAAAVGLAARSLTHELHELLRQLRDGAATVSAANKKLKNPELTSAIRILNGATRELGKMIATIDPMLPGARMIKENIDLQKFLTEYVTGREATALRSDVSLVLNLLPKPDGCIVRFSRTRLMQIVENLFQNSLYWLRQGPLPMPNLRRIDVTLNESRITWSDTGPGIKPSLESSVFDPYISDKPKSEGSGLGLHLISTFLELERCSIRLGDKRNSLGRRYEFELDLSGARPDHLQPTLNS